MKALTIIGALWLALMGAWPVAPFFIHSDEEFTPLEAVDYVFHFVGVGVLAVSAVDWRARPSRRR